MVYKKMTTIERIAMVEVEVKNLKESNDKDHKELISMMEHMNTKVDNFVESADNKFAGKWTEKLTITVVGGASVTIIALLIALL